MAYNQDVFLRGVAAGRNMHSWPAILPAASGTPGTGFGSDYTKTFIMGVQLGRRLKVLDALRQASPPPVPPVPSGVNIITEDGIPIMDERFGTLISLVDGGSLPVTEINYSTYPYWIVYRDNVPPPSAALTPGIYTVAETGITISLTSDGLNYTLIIGDLTPTVWTASYTDPEPCHLYFFRNYKASEGREYALLLYKDGEDSTFQLPMYFSKSTFNRLFFNAGNSGLQLITE